MHYKLRATEKRTYVNKGCNLENLYVITVISTVPYLFPHIKNPHLFLQVVDDDGEEQWLTPERRIKAMHPTSVQGNIKDRQSNYDHRMPHAS